MDIQKAQEELVQTLSEILRIKSLDIRCPHNRMIFQTNILGIVLYSHDDSTYCELMNKLNTTTEQVLIAYLGHMKIENTPKFCSAFFMNKDIRMQAYISLSQMTGQELISAIQNLLEIVKREILIQEEMLIAEMVETFGQVLVDNVKLITGKDLSRIPIRRSTLTMQRIQHSDVKNIIESMPEVIAKMVPGKRRQALSDIIYTGDESV